MKRKSTGTSRFHKSRLLAIAPLMLLALAGASHAQQVLTVAGEANGGGTSVVLRVKVPLVGWVTVPVTQSPIARAEIPVHGGSDDEAIASAQVPLGSLNVLDLEGIENNAMGSPDGASASAVAEARVSSATLLGGLVEIENLVSEAAASGQMVNGTTSVATEGSTYAQRVKVAGTVIFQSQEIPANTTVPINADLQLTILGLTLSLPLSGTLTLNEQMPLTATGLEVNAARLLATATVPNLAELSVDAVVAGPSVQIDETEPDIDQLCDNRPVDQCFRLDTDGDCRDVVRCVFADGGSNAALLTQIRCPAGLAFDIDRQTCDWKASVNNCDARFPQTMLRIPDR